MGYAWQCGGGGGTRLQSALSRLNLCGSKGFGSMPSDGADTWDIWLHSRHRMGVVLSKIVATCTLTAMVVGSVGS